MSETTIKTIVNKNLIQKNPVSSMEEHLEAFEKIKKIYREEIVFVEGLIDEEIKIVEESVNNNQNQRSHHAPNIEN